jgi:hypothetical protein
LFLGTGKPPKFEARVMGSNAAESGASLVIPDKESKTEHLPSYLHQLVSRAITSEDKFVDDVGSSRQTISKGIPSDDNVDGDFGPTKKTKGKTYVAEKAPVRVYTYQVSRNMVLCIVLFYWLCY